MRDEMDKANHETPLLPKRRFATFFDEMKMRSAFFPLLNLGLSSRARILALLLLLGTVTGTRVEAQIFGLSVTNTTGTNAISVNSPITFVINLTNQSATLLQSVFVTNTFVGPAAPQFVGATSVPVVSSSTNATSIAFNFLQMASGNVAQMTVTLNPTAPGSFTNSVIAIASIGTNFAATNIVIQVSPINSDLAVSLTPPATPIVVNDVITYRVAVTNLGTNAVANVVLTNRDFTSMVLRSLSPTNTFSRTNGQIYFNLGTLAGRGGKSFVITAQPTNAGPLTLAAAVTATNSVELNATNNFVSTNLTVDPLVSSNLVAANASLMTFNPQTGLMEQTVRLSNIGATTVPSARVMVKGLTYRLYNAVGTNSGNPYVIYGAALNPGDSANLVMEYFNPLRTAFDVPDSNYIAVATSAVNLTGIGPTNIAVSITNLGTAGILIEFPSILNRSYTIFYSPDTSFTNALTAQPSIVAPADRVQWIDNGPPKTVSHPFTNGSRFYRVQLNP